jgi:hypothetical protein
MPKVVQLLVLQGHLGRSNAITQPGDSFFLILAKMRTIEVTTITVKTTVRKRLLTLLGIRESIASCIGRHFCYTILSVKMSALRAAASVGSNLELP